MVGEEAINASLNNSEMLEGVLENLFPALMEKLGPLLTILKAVGIIFLVYVVYLIVRGFFRWKDRKRLRRIEEKIDEIDRKLDSLMKKNVKKRLKK